MPRNDPLGFGARVREVYHSLLQFDDHEDEWQFGRLVGCDSYGFAALYGRRMHNNILDVRPGAPMTIRAC